MSGATHALSSQVGGHAGVLASEDGSLIIKPSLTSEVAFYQLVSSNDEYAAFRPIIPKFLGTLKLEGEVDPAAAASGDGAGAIQLLQKAIDEKDEYIPYFSIVLENISAPFKFPNIMDVKLGTVLYDDGASEEKKKRMDEAARNTTSHETGVRLTGFQVYDHDKNEAINTPKSYGKTIKVSELPEGIAKFFPLSPSPPTSNSSEETTSKPTGRGLPKDILLPILSGIKSRIEHIRTVLSSTESRMIGGSLLIVYEADWETARLGLANGVEEEEVDEEDEDEDDEDGESEKVTLPYTVKLIDFAHTKFVPGEGPDERVLKGIDTTISLIEGRIKEVETQSAE